jgi:hypothetical protein
MRIEKAVKFEAMMRTDCALSLSRFAELLQIFILREPSTIEIEQFGIVLGCATITLIQSVKWQSLFNKFATGVVIQELELV